MFPKFGLSGHTGQAEMIGLCVIRLVGVWNEVGIEILLVEQCLLQLLIVANEYVLAAFAELFELRIIGLELTSRQPTAKTRRVVLKASILILFLGRVGFGSPFWSGRLWDGGRIRRLLALEALLVQLCFYVLPVHVARSEHAIQFVGNGLRPERDPVLIEPERAFLGYAVVV